MSTAIWKERIREVSPRFEARMAGGLYVSERDNTECSTRMAGIY